MSMRQNEAQRFLGLIYVLIVWTCAACGGGQATTAVSRDQQLSALSASDLETGCLGYLAINVYDTAVVRGVCAANLLTESSTTCTTDKVDACAAESEAAAAEIVDRKNCAAGAAKSVMRSSCSATVGELQDCDAAYHADVAAEYASITCSSQGVPAGDPSDTPACAPIKQKCPKVFGSPSV